MVLNAYYLGSQAPLSAPSSAPSMLQTPSEAPSEEPLGSQAPSLAPSDVPSTSQPHIKNRLESLRIHRSPHWLHLMNHLCHRSHQKPRPENLWALTHLCRPHLICPLCCRPHQKPQPENQWAHRHPYWLSPMCLLCHRVAGHRSQVASCRSQVAGCRSQVTVVITGCRSHQKALTREPSFSQAPSAKPSFVPSASQVPSNAPTGEPSSSQTLMVICYAVTTVTQSCHVIAEWQSHWME